MIIYKTHVAPEWVDYNGHMNDAEYARVFSLACEALIDTIGLDDYWIAIQSACTSFSPCSMTKAT